MRSRTVKTADPVSHWSARCRVARNVGRVRFVQYLRSVEIRASAFVTIDSRLPLKAFPCASGRCPPRSPRRSSPCVGKIVHDNPFVTMSRLASVSLACLVTTRYRSGLSGPRSGSCAPDVARADPSESPSLAPTHSLYTQSRIHPQAVHTTVLPPPQTRPYGVRPMGRTPIYDQLRGERINADVPAAEADPQVVGRRGRHHVLVVAPGPTAVVRPPGPGTGLDGNRHHLLETHPPVQPTGDEGRAVAVGGPRAALSLAAHARQAPAPEASSSPTLANASHNPAAQDTAAGHGAHWGQGGGTRPAPHTEPRPATQADAQFSWF
jgi:hypothetical protein